MLINEIAYFSPFDSDSNTFQKVYLLKYNKEISNYDKDGIEKIYYMTIEEIKKIIEIEPKLFKTDYSFVMNYLFNKKYL